MAGRSSSATSASSVSHREMIALTAAISSAEGMAALRAHSSSWGGGAQPFFVGEEPTEIGAEFGQERRVGAEVLAPEALMTERAGLPVGLHVGGFPADAEGHRHLADGVTEMLAVEEALHRRAGPFGSTVQLQPGELVDGLALPFVGHPVVPGGRQFRVAHQVGDHVDGGAAIGVALRVAVSERVAGDGGAVVVLAAGADQEGQPVDPGADPCAPRVTRLNGLTPRGLRTRAGNNASCEAGVSG